MKLERHENDRGIIVLSLSGRLDLQGTEEIEGEFSSSMAAASQSVIVDLSGVSFLASLGMRLLVTAAKGLRSHGHRLILLQPQPGVSAALEVAGLSQLLDIVQDEESAVRVASPSLSRIRG